MHYWFQITSKIGSKKRLDNSLDIFFTAGPKYQYCFVTYTVYQVFFELLFLYTLFHDDFIFSSVSTEISHPVYHIRYKISMINVCWCWIFVRSNLRHVILQKISKVITRQPRTHLDQSWTLVVTHYQIIVFFRFDLRTSKSVQILKLLRNRPPRCCWKSGMSELLVRNEWSIRADVWSGLFDEKARWCWRWMIAYKLKKISEVGHF